MHEDYKNIDNYFGKRRKYDKESEFVFDENFNKYIKNINEVKAKKKSLIDDDLKEIGLLKEETNKKIKENKNNNQNINGRELSNNNIIMIKKPIILNKKPFNPFLKENNPENESKISSKKEKLPEDSYMDIEENNSNINDSNLNIDDFTKEELIQMTKDYNDGMRSIFLERGFINKPKEYDQISEKTKLLFYKISNQKYNESGKEISGIDDKKYREIIQEELKKNNVEYNSQKDETINNKKESDNNMVNGNKENTEKIKNNIIQININSNNVYKTSTKNSSNSNGIFSSINITEIENIEDCEGISLDLLDKLFESNSEKSEEEDEEEIGNPQYKKRKGKPLIDSDEIEDNIKDYDYYKNSNNDNINNLNEIEKEINSNINNTNFNNNNTIEKQNIDNNNKINIKNISSGKEESVKNVKKKNNKNKKKKSKNKILNNSSDKEINNINSININNINNESENEGINYDLIDERIEKFFKKHKTNIKEANSYRNTVCHLIYNDDKDLTKTKKINNYIIGIDKFAYILGVKIYDFSENLIRVYLYIQFSKLTKIEMEELPQCKINFYNMSAKTIIY